jgi:hypothetical protein
MIKLDYYNAEINEKQHIKTCPVCGHIGRMDILHGSNGPVTCIHIETRRKFGPDQSIIAYISTCTTNIPILEEFPNVESLFIEQI